MSASLERDGGEARHRAEAAGRQFWAMHALEAWDDVIEVNLLAAPASDYVNGTVLAVDGGWLGR